MLWGGWAGLCAVTSPVPGEEQPQLTVHHAGSDLAPGQTRSLPGR